MNVTALQEKKKNEEMKMSMKKAGEERRHVTDFRKAVSCPSAVIQGAARQKNGLRAVPGITGTLRKTNSHFDLTQ